MIERLQHALEHVEELSPEAQDELAQQIEELTTPADEGLLEDHLSAVERMLPMRTRKALTAIGSARDLIDDDEFTALDRIRHESAPTPPLDLGDL
jgi:hypothetical protein